MKFIEKSGGVRLNTFDQKEVIDRKNLKTPGFCKGASLDYLRRALTKGASEYKSKAPTMHDKRIDRMLSVQELERKSSLQGHRDKFNQAIDKRLESIALQKEREIYEANAAALADDRIGTMAAGWPEIAALLDRTHASKLDKPKGFTSMMPSAQIPAQRPDSTRLYVAGALNTKSLAPGQGMVLGYNLDVNTAKGWQSQDSGHGIAVFRISNETYSLFDPNHGVFKFNSHAALVAGALALCEGSWNSGNKRLSVLKPGGSCVIFESFNPPAKESVVPSEMGYRKIVEANFDTNAGLAHVEAYEDAKGKFDQDYLKSWHELGAKTVGALSLFNDKTKGADERNKALGEYRDLRQQALERADDLGLQDEVVQQYVPEFTSQ
jgi:hypothetical protein